jgi:pimeloyl-ACP methyl ester carboxylesterase
MERQLYEGDPMDTSSEHHEIRLSGGTIRYRDEGPKDGPVLVFVHGFLVDGQLWRKVTAETSRWARCIRPDLPLGSHAIAMDDDADLSPRGIAALIAEFLEALDLREVTVVGNDTGGAITQVLVTEHPERIGRMVLTSCDAFEEFPPKLFKPLMAAARGPKSVLALLGGLRSATMRKAPFAYGWTAKHGIPDDVTEAWVRPALTDEGVRRDIAKVARGIDSAVTLDAAAKLAAFDKPTLIAWAAQDKFFSPELGRRLAAVIPDARFELIDDSYAFVPEDQPARLAALLEDFAGTHSAGKVPAGTSPG